MKTLGIDLASKPQKTAAIGIEWPESGSPRVLEGDTEARLTDDEVLRLFEAETWGRIAIDTPFGWPTDMLEVLNRWQARTPIDLKASARTQGSPAIHRATEIAVRERTGKYPIAVGVNNLAWVSLRVFHLLSAAGGASDRSGVSTRFVEAYPKGAQTLWLGIGIESTKKSAAARDTALGRIEEETGLIIGDARDEIIGEGEADHLFDALLCALVARAAMLAQTWRPQPELRATAEEEGWIHQPSALLSDLHPPRYLEVDLPEEFVVESLERGKWMEWARHPREHFRRQENGSYVCAGYGSPIFLRCVRKEGEKLHVLNGFGQPLVYRIRPQ